MVFKDFKIFDTHNNLEASNPVI